MSRRITRSAIVLLAGCFVVDVAAAQGAPPIGGVTGTVATEGSMKAFYHGAQQIIVTTVDGIDHVFEFTKDLIVHGGKRPGPDALAGLRDGTTVVVHYSAAGSGQAAREIDVVGDEGVRVTEGIVAHLDRRHRTITVRYDNGKTEKFELTDRAAAEAGESAADASRVVVYYTDDHGKKVVHFFKRVS
jgi:hypothetical protein